jgi:beta-galactosidase
LHLVWRIQYEPGTVTGVGYKDGVEILREEVKTAGEPAAIVLTPDRTEIMADGSDLSFITVTVVDREGIPVPRADNLIKFSLDGKGTIAGVDNGNQISMEPFKADFRKAFNGKCLLVVKSGAEAGNISVKASSDGLTNATTTVRVR